MEVELDLVIYGVLQISQISDHGLSLHKQVLLYTVLYFQSTPLCTTEGATCHYRELLYKQ